MAIITKQVNTDVFINGDAANDHLAVFEDTAHRLFVYGDTATAVTAMAAGASIGQYQRRRRPILHDRNLQE